jgi:hypothetical protein
MLGGRLNKEGSLASMMQCLTCCTKKKGVREHRGHVAIVSGRRCVERVMYAQVKGIYYCLLIEIDVTKRGRSAPRNSRQDDWIRVGTVQLSLMSLHLTNRP